MRGDAGSATVGKSTEGEVVNVKDKGEVGTEDKKPEKRADGEVVRMDGADAAPKDEAAIAPENDAATAHMDEIDNDADAKADPMNRAETTQNEGADSADIIKTEAVPGHELVAEKGEVMERKEETAPEEEAEAAR